MLLEYEQKIGLVKRAGGDVFPRLASLEKPPRTRTTPEKHTVLTSTAQVLQPRQRITRLNGGRSQHGCPRHKSRYRQLAECCLYCTTFILVRFGLHFTETTINPSPHPDDLAIREPFLIPS